MTAWLFRSDRRAAELDVSSILKLRRFKFRKRVINGTRGRSTIPLDRKTRWTEDRRGASARVQAEMTGDLRNESFGENLHFSDREQRTYAGK